MNHWNNSGVPHKGWIITDINDLGRNNTTLCEMCNTQEIRYVHTATHSTYKTPLYVGCVCAEKMSVGYDGKASEARLKKALAKKERDRLLNRPHFATLYFHLKNTHFGSDLQAQYYVVSNGWLLEEFIREVEKYFK